MSPPKIALLLVLAAWPSPGWGQVEILDRGTFRIWHAREEVGRETFQIQAVLADGSRGFRIVGTVSYPPRRTAARIAPTIEVGADSQPRFVQFEAGTDRLSAQLTPRRLTIQHLSAAGESWREYPGAPRAFVVDDSVFAMYAVPPRHASGRVRVIELRRRTQRDFELTDRGTEETYVDGRARRLRHFTLSAGPETHHLWYDTEGRLIKVEIPHRGIRVERQAEPAPPPA